MFNNLIESDIHTSEIKRRGLFIFWTALAYGLLVLAAGVGSIYAYQAQVETQSLELTTLVTMLPTTLPAQTSLPQRTANHQPRALSDIDDTARVPMRTARMNDVDSMVKIPTNVGVTGNNIPPTLPGAELGPRNLNVGGMGTPGSSNSVGGGATSGTANGSNNGGVELTREAPPEPPRKEVRQPPRIVSLGVIESKVLHKAVPPYPELAKRAHASGLVPVQILLDEQGRVVSAHATAGHPLLRAAAEQAAYQTRFSPTLLSNQPVKVTGIITFNFVLQ
ncbi:MAG TPA: energy transducer TonB [Pyrinomonadaceae bacterium]|jgi:protein TonB